MATALLSLPPFTLFPRFSPGCRNLQTRISSGSFSTRPETGCPVPQDQQPVNEYHNISSSFPFSWAASSDPLELGSKLFATGVSFSILVGLPVSWFGSGHGLSEPEPLRLLLGSVSSGIFATTFAVLRMYLGWAYVGNRLLSATVEYEETGWYDGQVKPILNRLKSILIVLAVSLYVCGVLVVDFETSQSAYRDSDAGEDRAVAGVYNEESARSFEPDAFCGEATLDSE